MAKKTNKQIFLEDLPKWKDGRNKGKICWEESIGHKVHFIYDDIEGDLEIIEFIKNKNLKNKIKIEYNNNTMIIGMGDILKCGIGKLLKKVTSDFKIELGVRLKDNKRDITIIDREYRDVNRTNGKNESKKWYKYICNICG